MKFEGRVGELEARAARLLDPVSGGFAPLLELLTDNETEQLDYMYLDAGDENALKFLWNELRPRAVARVAAGIDIAEVNANERASRRWLRLNGRTIISVYKAFDGVWRIDPIYRRQQPELPETFTDTEVEAWTIRQG